MKPKYPGCPDLIHDFDHFFMNYEGCDIYRCDDTASPWLVVWGDRSNQFSTCYSNGDRVRVSVPPELDGVFTFVKSLAALHQ